MKDLVCSDARVIPCNSGVAVAGFASLASNSFLPSLFKIEFSSLN